MESSGCVKALDYHLKFAHLCSFGIPDDLKVYGHTRNISTTYPTLRTSTINGSSSALRTFRQKDHFRRS